MNIYVNGILTFGLFATRAGGGHQRFAEVEDAGQPVEAIDERTYEKSARRHMSSSPRHSFNRDLGVLSFPSGVQPSAEAALASCARE